MSVTSRGSAFFEKYVLIIYFCPAGCMKIIIDAILPVQIIVASICGDSGGEVVRDISGRQTAHAIVVNDN